MSDQRNHSFLLVVGCQKRFLYRKFQINSKKLNKSQKRFDDELIKNEIEIENLVDFISRMKKIVTKAKSLFKSHFPLLFSSI
jgi:hypothetical protein